MARRSSRTQHLIGSRTLKEKGATINAGTAQERVVDIYEIKPLCGEKYAGSIAYGEDSVPYGYAKHDWAHDTCSTCQSKALSKKLKDMMPPFQYRMLDRVDMSAVPLPYGLNRYMFKSVYPVIDRTLLADDDQDKIVGFICIESGWGKSWEVYTWGDTTHMRDLDDGKIGEPKLDRSEITYIKGPLYPGADRSTYKSPAKRFASKEAALMEFPYMMEGGVLKTRGQVIAKAQAYLVEYREKEARRAAERAEQAAERERMATERQTKREALLTDIREALNDATLSNFNRDVMFRVAREAGFSEDELSGPLADAPAPATAEPLTDEWGEVIG